MELKLKKREQEPLKGAGLKLEVVWPGSGINQGTHNVVPLQHPR